MNRQSRGTFFLLPPSLVTGRSRRLHTPFLFLIFLFLFLFLFLILILILILFPILFLFLRPPRPCAFRTLPGLPLDPSPGAYRPPALPGQPLDLPP